MRKIAQNIENKDVKFCILPLFHYLYNTKKHLNITTMNEKSEIRQEQYKSLELTTGNGKQYRFTECPSISGGTTIYTQCYFLGKWNRLDISLKTLDEAREWFDRINRKESEPVPEFKPVQVPDGYYGVRGRYYGD